MIEWALLLPPAGVASALAAAAWLDTHGRCPHPPRTYDALIVAGCRVFPDGRPSRALSRRARVAADLWHRDVAPRIVLTGGPSQGAPLSEARAAAKLCEGWGVPATRLILEERSTSTLENAAFSAAILREHMAVSSVLVVSDAAHVFRCRRMFQRHFPLADAVGAPTDGRARLELALREAVAVVRHGIMGNL